jgi:hypothetical protein
MFCALGIVLAFAVSQAHAVAVPLVNPSFESPPLAPGPYSFNSGSGAIPGWTDATPDNNLGGVQNIGHVGSSTEVEFPNPAGGAPDGTQVAWLWGGVGDVGGPYPLSTSISQTTGVTVVAGTTYTLSGFYGQPLVHGTTLQSPQATSTVSILQGGVPQSVFSSIGPSGLLGPFTFSWTAQTSGGLLGVELETTNNYSYFDTISMTADPPVPEPATIALVGLGTVALAGLRRRRMIG